MSLFAVSGPLHGFSCFFADFIPFFKFYTYDALVSKVSTGISRCCSCSYSCSCCSCRSYRSSCPFCSSWSGCSSASSAKPKEMTTTLILSVLPRSKAQGYYRHAAALHPARRCHWHRRPARCRWTARAAQDRRLLGRTHHPTRRRTPGSRTDLRHQRPSCTCGGRQSPSARNRGAQTRGRPPACRQEPGPGSRRRTHRLPRSGFVLWQTWLVVDRQPLGSPAAPAEHRPAVVGIGHVELLL